MFYGGVAALLLGSKTLLNSTLDLVDATDEEKAAFGKVQDCFNEAGFDDKLLNIKSMAIYSPHPYPLQNKEMNLPKQQVRELPA